MKQKSNKKYHITAFTLILVVTTLLSGCNYNLPFLSKPEDAVKEFMMQDSLMEVISRFDDYTPEDDDDIASLFWSDFLTSPSVKSLMLDNVRSISYNITDISTNGDRAKITTLITHHDISPITDQTVEVLIRKLGEIDSSEAEDLEDDEILELLFSIIRQSFKEAVGKTQPSETYTKVRFDVYKNSTGKWEMKEIPEDFIEKVLLMNFQTAVGDSVNNPDLYSYIN